MTKIVITGHTSFCNRGNEVLVRSTIDLLGKYIPDASFTIFSQTSQTPEKDGRIFNSDYTKVSFVPLNYNPAVYYRKGRIWYIMQRYLGLGLRNFLRVDNESYREIKACDLLIVSGGDLLSGYGFDALRIHAHLALVAAALKKPVVIFAHSLNPFGSPQEYKFAKFFFNQVSLITVREQISYDYLKQMTISTPIHLAADPAFWLLPAPISRVEEILAKEEIPTRDNLVGISASAGMAWYTEGEYENYISALAAFADHIIEKHGLPVIFISHVIGPNQFGGDDRLTANMVIAKMKHQQGAYPIHGEYNCMELKGLIGRCDLFVGSRMHTTVSSTSMLIPTIGLAYSVKAHGVLGELIHSRSVVKDVEGLTSKQLILMSEDLLSNHDSVVEELAQNLPIVKEKALVTPRLAAQLII
jgi:polysaccharide pyruvyl transferase WcaK-like protein